MLSINEINFMNAQNEGLKQQNKTLQKNVIDYANKINKIYEICNEQADNISVVELQDRIKAVIDDTNNG